MTRKPDRRALLIGAASSLSAGLIDAEAASPATVRLGTPEPFSFDGLVARAKALGAAAYQNLPPPDPGLKATDLMASEQITYDPRMTLWGGPGEPAIRLFPLSRQFNQPVKIHLITDHLARQILYDPALFQTPAGHPFRRLRAEDGFAGFRVLNPGRQSDWMAFLGASYFRASGPFDQYGASARGLAINSGGPAPEEFPRFSQLWLQRQPGGDLLIHALLESPSVTGAFRIDTKRDAAGVVQEIEAALFFRRSVETLGVAPLTSMFWYGEENPPSDPEKPPEIHDSDGLAMWTGAGERIWRPLSNPPRIITNSFQDADPRGFGLSQRDRAFEHYEDGAAFYEKRPDVWVEPLKPFGVGSVRLVELPTERDSDDNIVAFWSPKARIAAGDALRFSYRLSWISHDEAVTPPLARVVATRTGAGEEIGLGSNTHRVSVDFVGDALKGLDHSSRVKAVVSSPNGGKINQVSTEPVMGTGSWRVLFEVQGVSGDPVDVRAYLQSGGKTLSETWLYQLYPKKK